MDIRLPAFLVAGALLLGPTSAAAQQPPPPQPQSATSKPQMTKPATSNADSQFLKKVTEDNLAEVELATLANSKSQNEQVKAYASKLLTDHQEAQSEVQTIAGQKNVTVPTEVPAAKKAVKDRLGKLDGAAFDKAYIAEMVKDHKQAISSFERAAKSADPDVKAFAGKMLPTLKEHLSQAQAMKITAPVPVQ
jgi:putative membrane protein